MLEKLFDRPILYQSPIFDLRKLLGIWFIGAFSGIIMFLAYERSAEIWFLYLLPFHSAFLIMFLIIYIFCRLLHYSFIDLFGISIENLEMGSEEIDYFFKSPLQQMFRNHEGYQNYMIRVKEIIHNPTREKIAVVVGYFLIFAVYTSDNYDGHSAILGNDPYPVSIFSPVAFLVVLFQTIVYGVIASGAISGLGLTIAFVNATKLLPSLQDTLLFNSDENNQNTNNHEIPKEDSEPVLRDILIEANMALFSLKRRRNQTNVIPLSMAPLSVLVLTMVIIALSGVLYYINLRGGNTGFTIASIIVAFIFFLTDFYIFFSPQVSLKRMISSWKQETLNSLDKLYNIQQELWVMDNNDEKINPYDVLLLDYIVDETNKLSPWPFNYNQIVGYILVLLLFLLFIIAYVNLTVILN